VIAVIAMTEAQAARQNSVLSSKARNMCHPRMLHIDQPGLCSYANWKHWTWGKLFQQLIPA